MGDYELYRNTLTSLRRSIKGAEGKAAIGRPGAAERAEQLRQDYARVQAQAASAGYTNIRLPRSYKSGNPNKTAQQQREEYIASKPESDPQNVASTVVDGQPGYLRNEPLNYTPAPTPTNYTPVPFVDSVPAPYTSAIGYSTNQGQVLLYDVPEPQPQKKESPSFVSGLRASAQRDVELSEQYARAGRRTMYETDIRAVERSRRRQEARTTIKSAYYGYRGIGTSASAGFYERMRNVPSNLKAIGTGVLFGSTERIVERTALSTKPSKALVGRAGVVTTRATGVGLGAYYGYTVTRDIGRAGEEPTTQERTRAYGDVLGGAAADILFFGLGRQTVRQSVPSQPYQTTGPTGSVRVRTTARGTLETTSPDLQKASEYLTSVERAAPRTTKLTYQEGFAGLRGLRGQTVKTTLTLTPEGGARRTQTFPGGKIVTTQARGTPESTVRLTSPRGKREYTGPDFLRNQIVPTQEITATSQWQKNLRTNVLLQRARSQAVYEVDTPTLKGTLSGQSVVRSVTYAEPSPLAGYERFVGFERTGTTARQDILFTRLVRLEARRTRLRVGRNTRELRSSLSSENVPPERVFVVSTPEKAGGVARLGVTLSRKGSPASRIEYESTIQGVLSPPRRFLSRLGRSGELRGRQVGVVSYVPRIEVPRGRAPLTIPRTEISGVSVTPIVRAFPSRTTTPPDVRFVNPLTRAQRQRGTTVVTPRFVQTSTPRTPRPTSVTVTRVIPVTEQIPIPTTITRVIPVTEQIPIPTTTPFKPVPPTGYTPPPPIIPPYTPPPPGIFPPLPFFGRGTRTTGRKKRTGRAYKYTPSLTSSVFKITAPKATRTLTGIEVRPIITRQPKKRKKRK